MKMEMLNDRWGIRSPARRAFTLVELVVVVALIIIVRPFNASRI